MSVDKNQAIIDYLLTCPYIAENSVFFNFGEEKDNNKQIITIADDKSTNRIFIDGSVEKQYSFTIIDYKSLTYNPIVTQSGYSNENIDDVLDVQSIIDWITTQNDNYIFPDFGDDCEIEDIYATTNNPNMNSVNTQSTPPLAKYSITIQVDYIDNSTRLWQ